MRPVLLLPALALLTAASLAQAQPPAPAARVVTVSGQGEASGLPDRARLSMAVEARNLDLRLAEAEVNKVVRAYLAELKALGIKDEDINTAGYSVNPEYDWVDNQQRFRGYLARRQIELTVRKLDQLGDALLRATKVGVNQINPPVLESSKLKEIERSALARAAADAQAQAQVLAETLGLKLGAARTVIAGGAQPLPPPVPMVKAMAMRADAAPEMSGNEQMGFAGGQIRANASVTVEFDLLGSN